jgi:hypothetical protein
MRLLGTQGYLTLLTPQSLKTSDEMKRTLRVPKNLPAMQVPLDFASNLPRLVRSYPRAGDVPFVLSDRSVDLLCNFEIFGRISLKRCSFPK